jgi:hypothetical protein
MHSNPKSLEVIQEKFIQASKREKYGLQQYFKRFNLFTDSRWKVYYSLEYDTTCAYDCLVQEIVDGGVKKRYIIEAKNRTSLSTYQTNVNKEEGWILEKSKIKRLKEIYNLDPVEKRNKVLYVNFTTIGTLVWDITHLMNMEIKSTKKNMNKQTVVDTNLKIDKDVVLLKQDDAKLYPYIFTERDYLNYQQELLNQKVVNKISKDDAQKIGFKLW